MPHHDMPADPRIDAGARTDAEAVPAVPAATAADLIAAQLELAPSAHPGDALLDAVAHLIGEPVLAGRSLGGGSTSRTFAVTTPDHEFVVKTNADVSVLARAANTLGVLADIGIPVPRVVAYDDSRDHVAASVLVMTKLRGRDLGLELPAMSPSQMTRLAEQIAEMQAKVATLPSGTGCGFVGIGDVATRTWADVVRHPTFKPPVEIWPDDCADLVPRVNALIDLVEPHLAAITPICFLDDVTTKNVLVESGELTGVVDFDVVCYGDPLFQIGLTAASITAGFSARCAFYVRELARLAGPTQLQTALLAAYEAVFLTQFLLSGSTEEDSPWRAVAAAAANNRLDDVAQFFMR